jgi:hypothetical protein
MNYWLLILPLLSALACGFVTWLSIRMFLNSTGLHQHFILEIVNVINVELPAGIDIEQKISDPALLRSVSPVIEKHVDDFLKIRLSKEMPFISHFIGDKTISSLKKIFMEELETLFPEVMRDFAKNLKTEIKLPDLISKKLSAFSPAGFKQILTQSLSKHIRKVIFLSFVVGFFFGVLEVIILYLTL